MPNITIPDPKKRIWTVPNEGDIFGILNWTKNLDLEVSPGKLRLSERLKIIYDNTFDGHPFTDGQFPRVFIRTDADKTSNWWGLIRTATDGVGSALIKATNPSAGTWARDDIASTPVAAHDSMEVFGKASGYDRLIVPVASGDLDMLNNGAWTASWWKTTLAQTALDANYPVVLKRFEKMLLIGNANFVHVISLNSDGTISGATNVAYKRLTFPANFSVEWINADSTYAWIGLTNLADGFDGVVARWNGGSETYETPMAVYDRVSFSSVIVDGIPWTMNGKGQLLAWNGQAMQEMAHLPIFLRDEYWTGPSNYPVGRYGMDVIDGAIHILINGMTVGAPTLPFENMPSGIWVYNKDIGLYCKYTLGQFTSTNNEWGSKVINCVGALKGTDRSTGKFVVGAEFYTDNATTLKQAVIVASSSTTLHRGLFVTSQIPTASVRALWKKITARFKKLENSTDAIIIKARTAIDPLKDWEKISLTASTTSIFVSTSTALANAIVGDELEIFMGKGAGTSAHIAAISYANPTYTVTLDEAIPNTASTCAAYLTNFKKLGSITDQSIQERAMGILKKGHWIQFKVELRGTTTSPELSDLMVEYEPLNN